MKTPSNKTITIDVDHADSVEKIKKKVFDNIGFAPDTFHLLFAGKVLDETSRFEELQIPSQSILNLVNRVDVPMEISILTFSGKKIRLNAKASDSIKSLKLKIQEQEKIEVNQQILTFEGMQLQDEKTLESFHIKTNSTIHLTFRFSSKTGSSSNIFWIFFIVASIAAGLSYFYGSIG